MLLFCKLMIIAAHPLLGQVGSFDVHSLPCFECRKIIEDNRVNIIRSQLTTGLELSVSCGKDDKR